MNMFPVFICQYLMLTSQSWLMIRPSTWESANMDPSNPIITGEVKHFHKHDNTHVTDFDICNATLGLHRYWTPLMRWCRLETSSPPDRALTPSTVRPVPDSRPECSHLHTVWFCFCVWHWICIAYYTSPQRRECELILRTNLILKRLKSMTVYNNLVEMVSSINSVTLIDF